MAAFQSMGGFPFCVLSRGGLRMGLHPLCLGLGSSEALGLDCKEVLGMLGSSWVWDAWRCLG